MPMRAATRIKTAHNLMRAPKSRAIWSVPKSRAAPSAPNFASTAVIGPNARVYLCHSKWAWKSAPQSRLPQSSWLILYSRYLPRGQILSKNRRHWIRTIRDKHIFMLNLRLIMETVHTVSRIHIFYKLTPFLFPFYFINVIQLLFIFMLTVFLQWSHY